MNVPVDVGVPEANERRSANFIERLLRGLNEPVADGVVLRFVGANLLVEQLAGVDDRPAPKVRNRAEWLTDSMAEERGSVSVIEPGHVFDPTIASPGLKVCPRGQEGDLLDAAVGDGTVLVLSALHVAVFDEVFEPVANGASARVVLVFEFHDEIGNHVTAVGNHLIEEFVRQRRLSRSRHTLRCNFGHHNVDHTGNNHSSCPRGEELCVIGHTDNNMKVTA